MQKYKNATTNINLGDPALDILEELFAYAFTKEKFDQKYLNSIENFLENNGYITENQYNTLVKIYYAYRLNKNAC